jgi:hypothetical protein
MHGPSLTSAASTDHHELLPTKSRQAVQRVEELAQPKLVAPLAPVIRQLSNALPARQHDI